MSAPTPRSTRLAALQARARVREPAAPAPDPLRTRVAALVHAFDAIARTRMRGVPILHPSIRVEAVGFTLVPPASDSDTASIALGVLLTPWFMNLVRLPIVLSDRSTIGAKQTHRVGDYEVEFIGAFEPELGAFESCSLFSPLPPFESHAVAVETAHEVMRTLTPPTPQPSAPNTAAVGTSTEPSAPRLGRRALFLGRAPSGAHR
ncbi:MAG: [NiFe]-hydrogenase assembly chaperone HybE [Polyangiales bacterium]